MAKIVVTGGNALNGEVNVSGAKNAVLPILCATLLADGPVEIGNVPYLHDVVTTIKLLRELGGDSVIGPMLIGMEQPVQVATMSSTANSPRSTSMTASSACRSKARAMTLAMAMLLSPQSRAARIRRIRAF